MRKIVESVDPAAELSRPRRQAKNTRAIGGVR
jgi:hypothetical protein